MKKKLILASAILATTINSGFCATGQGYRILSEEIHSAPGFNFHVEEAQPGTAAALKKNKLYGSTSTSVPAKSG